MPFIIFTDTEHFEALNRELMAVYGLPANGTDNAIALQNSNGCLWAYVPDEMTDNIPAGIELLQDLP